MPVVDAYKDLGIRGGAKGMEAAGYTLVRQDMGTKAAARAAENYLIGKATKGGRKFTKPKTPYDKSSDDLLNKEWGTKWDRKSEGADDWFNGFWPEIMNRTGPAWKAVDDWFS